MHRPDSDQSSAPAKQTEREGFQSQRSKAICGLRAFLQIRTCGLVEHCIMRVEGHTVRVLAERNSERHGECIRSNARVAANSE